MRIVYKNKLELKFLLIAFGVIFGALYLFITITDLSVKNPSFWHNQLAILQMVLLFSIPCIIIGRHRIVFDFEKRTVTRRGFISSEKTYNFSEIDLEYDNKNPRATRFIFRSSGKVIFKLEEFDFEKQSGESSDWLKELFKGEALEIFRIEKRLNNLDIIAYANRYLFTDGLKLYIENRYNSSGARLIVATYLSDEDNFELVFGELYGFDGGNDSGTKIIKATKLLHDENLENNLAELSRWVIVDDE